MLVMIVSITTLFVLVGPIFSIYVIDDIRKIEKRAINKSKKERNKKKRKHLKRAKSNLTIVIPEERNVNFKRIKSASSIPYIPFWKKKKSFGFFEDSIISSSWSSTKFKKD